MKTAVSMPDRVFDAAEELANRLGISRSQLYATALEAYIRAQRGRGVTEALDRVYVDQSPDLDPAIAAIQASSIGEDEW